MGRLVKATPSICAMCKYRSGQRELGCNYSGITGRLRTIENKQQRLPHGYCDVFERGKRLESGWKVEKMTILPTDYIYL